ncbi:ABC transporter ATP-binding protein [Vallitalea guaymasensis]|uniref:ABC transporter ATP-binding protein n=1 Tax=Vallitalea guaymasensis TaxID=1185412 RepID=A0A8J8SBK2_9FIRM|nr:ABC transporter ATP-binding protein [Vallitalea guaymasensis]QUH28421.1 ABC transporter ATP-binding protein [Vallitalea guaymasensis]
MKKRVNRNIARIYGKSYKRMLVVVFIGAFIAALSQLFYTYEIGVVIDVASHEEIVRNTIIIGAAVIIRVLTSFIKKRISFRVKNRFLYRLRKMVAEKICYSDYKELEAKDDKKILSIMSTDVDGFIKWFDTLFLLGELPIKLGLCIIYIFYMFYTSWTLIDLVAIIGLLLITLLLNNIWAKRIYPLTMKERDNKGQVINYFINSLNFRMMIKAYNMEKKFMDDNKIKLSNLKKSERKTYLFNRMMNYYAAMNGYFGFLLVLGIGAKNIINGTLQLGQLVSMLFLMDIVGQGITILQSIPANYQNVRASIDRVNSILDLKDNKEEQEESKENINNNNPSNIAYEIKNLSFCYTDSYILKNISFSINKGEKIAIVGKSGCGKSTLLKLLCNLYEPQEGSIEFMGQPINNMSKKRYYENIAVVTQESFILDDTIGNNVRIVDENKKTTDVKRAVTKAQLNEYIATLENGLDTVIGTGSHMLSNGQDQRVNIARAFLKDSQVYICDEPTSALDEDNTNRIMDIFLDDLKDKTFIVICHSGIDFERFDRVLFIKDARIAGYAPHMELMEKNEEYGMMFAEM